MGTAYQTLSLARLPVPPPPLYTKISHKTLILTIRHILRSASALGPSNEGNGDEDPEETTGRDDLRRRILNARIQAKVHHS